MKTSTSILVIIILILIIVIMGGVGLWYFFSGRIGNRDIYEAVNGHGHQMQEQLDRRSDAIETKLDRLGMQLGAIHDLSARTDAQAARIEGKLDKLLQLVEKHQPIPMESAPDMESAP